MITEPYGVEIQIGVDYTGGDAFVFASDTTRNLLTEGLSVALEYTDNSRAQHSFPSSAITGAAGSWQITVPIAAEVTETLDPFLGRAELAVYLAEVEKPKLRSLAIVVSKDL